MTLTTRITSENINTPLFYPMCYDCGMKTGSCFYHNYSVAAVLKTLQLPVSCTSDISVYSLDMC